MRPFARILALSGVILLGIAAVVPITTYAGIECAGSPGAEVLVNPTCFEDDVQDGFLISYLGIILLAVALIGVLPAIGGRPAVLWVYTLTALGIAMVLFFYFDALKSLGGIQDYDWGIGVLFGGVTLLLLATIVASFNASRQANRVTP